jgi:ATP-dependent helicase/nuclease subunit A
LRPDERYEDTWYRRFTPLQGFAALPDELAEVLPDSRSRSVRDFLPPACSFGALRLVLDDEPVRLGRAWHALLERVSTTEQLARVDRGAIARRFALDEGQVARVFDAAQAVLSAPHLARFFAHGDAELELLDAGGELLRIDRIVGIEGTWWVVDFKWRVTAEERPVYTRQVRRYCEVVQAVHPDKAVRGALIAADGELIELD